MHQKLQMANRLLEQKLFANAAELYREVYTSKKDPEALYGLAICAYQEEEFGDSLDYINQLLQVDQKHAGAYNLAGLIAAGMQDFEGAKALFVAAVESAPTFLEAQRNYGEVLLELEDFENAVRVFNAILENHPEDVITLIRMAELYAEVERHRDAVLLLGCALDIEPDNVDAMNLLNRIQEAIATEK